MYKLVDVGVALNLETGESFLVDSDNRHAVEYRAWLALGNQPLPMDPPIVDEAEEAARVDFEALAADITNELAWIETALTEIDTGLGLVDAATLAQLRAIVKGMLQNQRRILLEQRGELRAWRYVIRQVA